MDQYKMHTKIILLIITFIKLSTQQNIPESPTTFFGPLIYVNTEEDVREAINNHTVVNLASHSQISLTKTLVFNKTISVAFGGIQFKTEYSDQYKDMGPMFQIGYKGQFLHGVHIKHFTLDGDERNMTQFINDTYGEDYPEKLTSGYTRSCIEVNGVHDLDIEQATIKNCRSGGVVVGDPGNHIVIKDSTIENPFFDCIAVDGSSNGVQIENNKLTGAPYAAISLDTGAGTIYIRNNVIDGNTDHPRKGMTKGDVGLFTRDIHSVQYTGNTIRNVNHGSFMGLNQHFLKTLIVIANQYETTVQNPLSGDFSSTMVITDVRNPMVYASNDNTDWIYTNAESSCPGDCGHGVCKTNGFKTWCDCAQNKFGDKCQYGQTDYCPPQPCSNATTVVVEQKQCPSCPVQPTQPPCPEPVTASPMTFYNEHGWKAAAGLMGAVMLLAIAAIAMSCKARTVAERLKKATAKLAEFGNNVKNKNKKNKNNANNNIKMKNRP